MRANTVFKDVSRDTLVGVIVTLVLGGLGLLWQPARDLVYAIISGTYSWMTGNYVVAHWWYWTLLSLSTIFVGILIRAAYVSAYPSHRIFTAIRRFNIVWRWEWGWKQPHSITPFCPRCDRVMTYAENGHLNRERLTMFSCDPCGIKQPLAQTFRETVSDIDIEIDHALRTGVWQKEMLETGRGRS